MEQGDCFFNSATRQTRSHPWIVLSDPGINPDDVLIVNLTDAKSHHDDSCILVPDDYPDAVSKKSCVAYMYAKITSISQLEQADALGLLIHKPKSPAIVIAKILEGASLSDELKGSHRKLLRDQGLID